MKKYFCCGNLFSVSVMTNLTLTLAYWDLGVHYKPMVSTLCLCYKDLELLESKS